MFPGVRILEEFEVVAIALWSWLIAVHLSLPEEFSVVVTVLAVFHLFGDTFSSFNRVRKSENSSVIALLVVGSKS